MRRERASIAKIVPRGFIYSARNPLMQSTHLISNATNTRTLVLSSSARILCLDVKCPD